MEHVVKQAEVYPLENVKISVQGFVIFKFVGG